PVAQRLGREGVLARRAAQLLEGPPDVRGAQGVDDRLVVGESFDQPLLGGEALRPFPHRRQQGGQQRYVGEGPAAFLLAGARLRLPLVPVAPLLRLVAALRPLHADRLAAQAAYLPDELAGLVVDVHGGDDPLARALGQAGVAPQDAAGPAVDADLL